MNIVNKKTLRLNVSVQTVMFCFQKHTSMQANKQFYPGGGGTPYIRMIGMIVVFFRGCNRRFGIF